MKRPGSIGSKPSPEYYKDYNEQNKKKSFGWTNGAPFGIKHI
jgi:hypothetical protein